MRHQILALTLITLAVLLGCSSADRSHSTNSNTPSETTPNLSKSDSPDENIDAAMQNVASEFKRRLAYYNGELVSLRFENGEVAANWRSQKCDWVKEEIIDLVISLNRGHSGVVNGISINRTCDSRVKTFKISGAKFSAYKSGQIGDPQFLEGIR